jgi:3-hydroxyacyl-CoA dehydrogenase/enoyl-CoA hydratase/3-hydroxybutyryl-CoA epimerase
LQNQISISLDLDGVLLATIDMPGRSMNVFSVELMDALDELIARVETDPDVKSVVLTSGKSSFLAGADLSMIRDFTESARTLNEEQMFELCGRLGRQFVRIEASEKPWIAAVNGTALGGGLELAMACRERITSDNSRALIGLPEARWGLLPGAGGTQRMPRLIGFEEGLNYLINARSMSPTEAVQMGLFKSVTTAERLISEASNLAKSIQAEPFNPSTKFSHINQNDVPEHTAETVKSLATKFGVSDEDFENYPAYRTIISCVLLGARLPLDEASSVEMHQFLKLMFNPVAGNMVRTLFLNRQRADKTLAACSELIIEQVNVGWLSTENALWGKLLKKSRLTVVEDESLPKNSITLIDSDKNSYNVTIETTAAIIQNKKYESAHAVLSPVTSNGCVLEIIADNEKIADLLAFLAGRLGALPYRTYDSQSVLNRLALSGQKSLEAQSLEALRLFASGAVKHAEFLDVAACAAGLSPTWTGGPLTFLWANNEKLQSRFDPNLQSEWSRVRSILKSACS